MVIYSWLNQWLHHKGELSPQVGPAAGLMNSQLPIVEKLFSCFPFLFKFHLPKSHLGFKDQGIVSISSFKSSASSWPHQKAQLPAISQWLSLQLLSIQRGKVNLLSQSSTHSLKPTAQPGWYLRLGFHGYQMRCLPGSKGHIYALF